MLEIKRTYINFIFFSGFGLFLFTDLFAQKDTSKNYLQPLQDVFQTELVYPQEKNEIQLTIAPEFQRLSNYDYFQLPFVLEYGLTDMWQVEFEWNTFQKRFIESGQDVSGTGDIEIGMRYSFMNISNTNFHTAAGFGVGIPIGDENKGLGTGVWEYEPFVLAAFDLPSLNNIQLFAQAGVGFVQHKAEDGSEEEESENNELNVSGGIFVPFNKVIFTSELTWHSSKWSGGDEDQLYLTPGIVFNLPDGWETGIGVPIGLNDQSDKFRIMIVLTFEFNLAGDDE